MIIVVVGGERFVVALGGSVGSDVLGVCVCGEVCVGVTICP